MLEQLSPITTNQFINFVLVNEALSTYQEERAFNPSIAQEKLKEEYSITTNARGTPLRQDYLKYRLKQLKSGERPLLLPSILRGKASTRHYKDLMYAELGRLVDCFIGSGRTYCGLPAMQLHHLPDWLTPGVKDFALGCEVDEVIYKWIRDVHTIVLERPTDYPWIIPEDIECVSDHRTGLLHTDIFSYLAFLYEKKETNIYNVIDLDLMVTINSVRNLDFIAQALYRIMRPTSIINITTAVGRSISDLEYEAIMPHTFEILLRDAGFDRVKSFSGRYLDRRIPMRYEHIILIK